MPTKNQLVLQLHIAEDKCKELEMKLQAAEKERDAIKQQAISPAHPYKKAIKVLDALIATHPDNSENKA